MTKKAESPKRIDLDDVEDLMEADVPIKHPSTGAVVGTIRLMGPENPVRRRLMFARIDRMNADAIAGVHPSAAESFDLLSDDLADITAGWDFTKGGQPLPFSRQAAAELYSDPKRGWIRAQVVAARDNRERFIGTSANG